MIRKTVLAVATFAAIAMLIPPASAGGHASSATSRMVGPGYVGPRPGGGAPNVGPGYHAPHPGGGGGGGNPGGPGAGPGPSNPGNPGGPGNGGGKHHHHGA
jgi:hypothetical protein